MFSHCFSIFPIHTAGHNTPFKGPGAENNTHYYYAVVVMDAACKRERKYAVILLVHISCVKAYISKNIKRTATFIADFRKTLLFHSRICMSKA